MTGVRGARVGLVVNRVEDFALPVVRGLESVLAPAGASLLLLVHPAPSDHPRPWLERLVRAGSVDALVVTAVVDRTTGSADVRHLVRQAGGLPVVTLGSRVPGVPDVSCDNADGASAAAAHLLAGGRRRPLVLAGPLDSVDSAEREEAFAGVVAAAGLPPSPLVRADYHRDTAYRRALDALRAAPDADAVFAANDEMALGALDALATLGRRVPQDVAVVGFDDTPAAATAEVPLTTVDPQLQRQGEQAGRLVLALLAGEEVPDRVRTSCELVVRGSTDRAPGALPVPASTALPDGDLARRARAAVLARLQRAVPAPAVRAVPAARTAPGAAATAGASALEELVRERPEQAWWRRVVAASVAGLGVPADDPVVAAAVREVEHEVERGVSAALLRGTKAGLQTTHHLLELKHGLAQVTGVEELAGELAAYLPRVAVRRAHLALVEDGLARLVFCSGAPAPGPGDEPYPAQELLPRHRREALGRVTLVVRLLVLDGREQGLLVYEQEQLDRYTGQALQRDLTSALEALQRHRDARARAAELERLVAERTAQLRAEVRTRRLAQEELTRANQRLQEALLVDGLTGVRNRPAFDDALRRAWCRHRRTGEPLSVLVCDVDRFKLYNDSAGHLAGDACLRAVAACISTAVSRDDDVVARFGGEEFAVVLPDTGVEGAVRVAERVLARVRAAALPHPGCGEGATVSVSVGVATSAGPAPAASFEELLREADAALYRAKGSGRDRLALAAPRVSRV
ncbi:diguanylate cyclase [Kineococcus gypseus]|uniref:diguanylate cyclase n=1 Tax=Kineococcus gypseus TaxID=1637102 RepID=UPI003D7CA766